MKFGIFAFALVCVWHSCAAAAEFAEQAIGKSLDGRFEVRLTGEKTDDGRRLFYEVEIRDAATRKVLPFPANEALDHATGLSSASSAYWSPDSSMVVIAITTHEYWEVHLLLHWDGSQFVSMSLPAGTIPLRWLPSNQLVCSVPSKEVFYLDSSGTNFTSAPAAPPKTK